MEMMMKSLSKDDEARLLERNPNIKLSVIVIISR